MRQIVFIWVLLLSGPAWCQFLVSREFTGMPIEAPLDRWRPPRDLLTEIRIEEPPEALFSGDPKQVISIVQGEYAVLAASDANYSVLSSNSALSGIILVLKSSDGRGVALGYIDDLTHIADSIKAIQEEMKSVASAPVHEAILTSQYADSSLLRQTVQELKRSGVKTVRFFRASAVAVNAKSELFFNRIYSDNVAPLRDREQRPFGTLQSYLEEQQKPLPSDCNRHCLKNRGKPSLRLLYKSPAVVAAP